MTCWGKWNATWHLISTLFCWCLSAVETLIERLHEARDVQSCLFVLKLVVQRKEWSRSLALGSAQGCGESRLRHRNRSWLRPLESMLVFWFYTTSTFLNRLSLYLIYRVTEVLFFIWFPFKPIKNVIPVLYLISLYASLTVICQFHIDCSKLFCFLLNQITISTCSSSEWTFLWTWRKLHREDKHTKLWCNMKLFCFPLQIYISNVLFLKKYH